MRKHLPASADKGRCRALRGIIQQPEMTNEVLDQLLARAEHELPDDASEQYIMNRAADIYFGEHNGGMGSIFNMRQGSGVTSASSAGKRAAETSRACPGQGPSLRPTPLQPPFGGVASSRTPKDLLSMGAEVDPWTDPGLLEEYTRLLHADGLISDELAQGAIASSKGRGTGSRGTGSRGTGSHGTGSRGTGSRGTGCRGTAGNSGNGGVIPAVSASKKRRMTAEEAVPIALAAVREHLDPNEALQMTGKDHEMAFGALVGYRDAQMVPPGGFRPGMLPGARYGYGHGFAQALGEAKAENNSLRQDFIDLQHNHQRQIAELMRFNDEHDFGVNDDLLDLGGVGRFESKEKFAQRLVKAGLLEKQPSAKHEGQHVYHIISASNGGPDHTDNYLYALGGSFNIAVGDRFDHLNYFLAGKAKALKAVDVARKVAADERLHHHIDKRRKARPTTFFQGRHRDVTSGHELYKKGEDLFRDMREAARGQTT